MKDSKCKLSDKEINKYIKFLRTRDCSDDSIIDSICKYLLTGDASAMIELLLKNTSRNDYVETLLLVEVESEFF